jgi:hypothetical protein
MALTEKDGKLYEFVSAIDLSILLELHGPNLYILHKTIKVFQRISIIKRINYQNNQTTYDKISAECDRNLCTLYKALCFSNRSRHLVSNALY